MEIQGNKRMRFYLVLIKIAFAISVILNLVLPTSEGSWLHPSPINFVVIGIWFYGLLCALGYFRKATTEEDSNGVIEYEIKVPFTPVIVTRTLQLVYMLLFQKVSAYFLPYFVLLVSDLVVMLVYLVYKASFYYISMPVDGDSNESSKSFNDWEGEE